MMTQKKKIGIGIGVAVLILVFLAVLGLKAGGDKVQKLLDLGQEYIDDMDYEAAIAVFDEVIAIDPKCEEAYVGKANAQYLSGAPEEAIETLYAGMELVEDTAVLEVLLDEILAEMENSQKDTEWTETVQGDADTADSDNTEPFILLNYSQVVKAANTTEPDIQLEVIASDGPLGELTWESDNPECATVSEDGLVTCQDVTEGEYYNHHAVISVTDGIRSSKCEIRIVSDRDIENGYYTELHSVRLPFELPKNNVGQYIIIDVLDSDNENGIISNVAGYLMEYIYYAGDIEIPEKLSYQGQEIPVTKLSSTAFRWCNQMTSVTIPASVNEISEEVNPFAYCTDLKEIKLEPGNEAFQIIDGALCTKNGKTLIAYPAAREGSSFTISKEVENISANAFTGCRNLERIQVEQDNPFYESREGTLVRKEGDVLLAYPIGKKGNSYTVPDGIKGISADAFYACDLESITCNSDVSEIWEGAFRGCEKLKYLNGEGIQQIEYLYSYLLPNCPALEMIEVGKKTKQVYLPDQKGTIELKGLSNAKNLERIEIGNCNLKNFEELQSLTNLESLSIGVENLEDISFVEGMGKLTELKIYAGKTNETAREQIEKLREKKPNCIIDVVDTLGFSYGEMTIGDSWMDFS